MMKYNTSNSLLVIPEYGRNIQRLIEHAKSIEDKPYRQAFVEKIVNLIVQMHPQTRNVDDYRDKVWSHVFMIADYELDIDAPCKIIHKTEKKRPAQVPYPLANRKYRHYGKNVHSMIQKAVAMEDKEKQTAFAAVIGAYMKMAYKTWNRESVSHDIIKMDLEKMSDGSLTISEETYHDATMPAKKRNSRDRDGRDSRDYKNSRHKGKSNKNHSYKRRKK